MARIEIGGTNEDDHSVIGSEIESVDSDVKSVLLISGTREVDQNKCKMEPKKMKKELTAD